MKAKYLGLDLSSPIVVSSSPYTASIGNVEQCVRNGAGAVVLKSIFEEQIYRQAASLDRMEGYGDAGEYLERYLGEAYKAELLELVSDAAKTGIPVIGSINCAGAGDAWIEYAAAMQVCTAIHKYGYEVIGEMNRFIDAWAARQGFESLDEFRGRMDYGSSEGDFYQRVQYMKYFPHDTE